MSEQETNTNSKVMLSTIDNPYDPFTQFDEWSAFDISKGYNSCSFLARIAKSSDELSETDQAFEIEKAIDEIIHYNVLGIYIKVTPDYFKSKSNVQVA